MESASRLIDLSTEGLNERPDLGSGAFCLGAEDSGRKKEGGRVSKVFC